VLDLVTCLSQLPVQNRVGECDFNLFEIELFSLLVVTVPKIIFKTYLLFSMGLVSLLFPRLNYVGGKREMGSCDPIQESPFRARIWRNHAFVHTERTCPFS
jgi:hypothetical protein